MLNLADRRACFHKVTEGQLIEIPKTFWYTQQFPKIFSLTQRVWYTNLALWKIH